MLKDPIIPRGRGPGSTRRRGCRPALSVRKSLTGSPLCHIQPAIKPTNIDVVVAAQAVLLNGRFLHTRVSNEESKILPCGRQSTPPSGTMPYPVLYAG